MGVKFCTLKYTVENKKKITVQITSNNNNILYYIDDNGGFIKEAIMRVRACCIDEIALAFNALTNRNPGLAPTRHHHNKIIMFYNNSKNTPKNYVLWNTILVQSISKKPLFNPFFFVKLDDINSYKTPKFRYNRM